MLERAIVQQIVRDADGFSVVRACPRPEHVRSIAERMHAWRQTPEGCATCGDRNAVAFRTGRPVCGVCAATERRVAGFDVSPMQHRAAPDGEDKDAVLRGYSIVFGQPSVDLGGFIERIAPQAAKRTFTENIDVRALADHDSSKVLGRRTAGTLQLRVDKHGVFAEILPPKTSVASDLLELVGRRDITGQSFGFMVVDDDWEMKDGMPNREVTDMRIAEVSVVGFPAYVQTSIEVSSRGASHRSIAWRERELKSARAR